MCRVCDQVKGLEPRQALTLIGGALAKGQPHAHFKELIDQILGTVEPESDPTLDAHWESKRNQSSK
jgi:hypothetical protein